MPDNYDDLSDDLAARREAFPEPDFDSHVIEACRAVDMSALGGVTLSDFFGPFLILPDDDATTGGGFTVGVPTRIARVSVGAILVNLTGNAGAVRLTAVPLGGTPETHTTELTSSSSGQFATVFDGPMDAFTVDLQGVTMGIKREIPEGDEITGSLWLSGLAVRFYAG